MNQIIFSNQYNDKLNTRFILFHGNDDNFKNGKVNCLCNTNKSFSFDNYLYLKEFLAKYYSDDLAIKRIVNDNFFFDRLFLLFFMINEYNMIIIEDNTKDSDLNTNNHNGIVYLPETVTNSQKEKLLNMKEYLKKYKQLTVVNLSIDPSTHGISKNPIEIITPYNLDRLDELVNVSVDYKKVLDINI